MPPVLDSYSQEKYSGLNYFIIYVSLFFFILCKSFRKNPIDPFATLELQNQHDVLNPALKL